MKSIVIVGVASSLGEKLCQCYAKKGFNIALVDWNSQNKNVEEGLLADCRTYGSPKSTFLRGNLSSLEEWKRIFNTIQQTFGGVDILLYLDGSRCDQIFKDIPTLAIVSQMMENNFVAPIYAISCALPILRACKGQVLVMGDTSEKSKSSLYRSSKQTLSAFISTIRKEELLVNFSIFQPSKDPSLQDQNVNLLVESLSKKEFRITNSRSADRNTKVLKRSAEALEPEVRDPPRLRPDTANKLCLALFRNNKLELKDQLRSSKTLSCFEEKDADGRTALHYACFLGQLENFTLIISKLKKKHLINEPDNYKFAPLHLACFRGHLKIVKKLMKHSADPNFLGNGNMSPLHYLARLDPIASCSNNQKVNQQFHSTLRELIDAGADSNQRNIDWATPLHEACKSGSFLAVEFLLKHEGDVHRKTKTTNETPLHWAIRNGNPQIIKLLLERGADPSAGSAHGTCFDIADDLIADTLEQYRDKNRRQESDSEGQHREVLIADRLEDLPADAMKMIVDSHINERPDLMDHWPVLLHVLKFLTKRIYVRTGENPNLQHHTKVAKSRANPALSLDEATEKFISNGNPRKLFKIVEDAGKGGFGSVFKARKLDDKKYIAIKKISHLTEKEQWSNLDEIHFLQVCAHRNVVKYYNSFISRDELWVIMEYMEGGTLSEVVTRKLEEVHINYVVKNVLKGLQFIHSKGIAHRDLKSANIMLSITASVKIIDFGLCADTATGQLDSMVGSPFWIPPEMIQRKPHGCPADIWSLGIIIIEMATGRPPNRNSSLKAMFEVGIGNVSKLDEDKWSKPFLTFLDRMLVINPDERATAEDLLKDPWITSSPSNAALEMRDVLRSVFLEKSLELSLGIGQL